MTANCYHSAHLCLWLVRCVYAPAAAYVLFAFISIFSRLGFFDAKQNRPVLLNPITQVKIWARKITS